ncbi:hypothetical protein [Burkholderia cepacia]|uniref:hypothetical protein n=1 Tax=Burkholderia cepacia TaxID=292 RepID=UPI001CF122EE|nr:hypothetical protein [Burkholderia cepacia]MCA8110271.1 hypothetical protein [Burkholderia cepacia]MCA8396570.1 hypothetical protein [Burkholderia cepacia]
MLKLVALMALAGMAAACSPDARSDPAQPLCFIEQTRGSFQPAQYDANEVPYFNSTNSTVQFTDTKGRKVILVGNVRIECK